MFLHVFSWLQKPINIIFGPIDYRFNNNNRTLRIDIQSEHTLVKLGGRSVDEIIYGNIDLLDLSGGKYLIRVPNYDYYSKLDATIEYSLPNIDNLKTNSRFTDYLERAIYIAPVMGANFYSDRWTDSNRIGTITIGNVSERRELFAAQTKIPNVQGVLSIEDLKRLYERTQIMVNVHQTDHHHTFEELRVLPALANGVIVISEEVPLINSIPYAESIIWSTFEDLPNTIKEVQDNYKFYRDKIFDSELEYKINDLHKYNIRRLIRKLS